MTTGDSFATKGELAYRRVRTLLLSGELSPGAVLHQATLARTIGISTTPLREALRRLEQEGLVELDAHRDARVTRLDATEARDLVEVRRGLEPLAASLAADRRTDEDLATMRAALDGLASLERDPSTAALAAHRSFHAAVHRAAGNRLLSGILDGLWDKADRYRRHDLEQDRSADDMARSAEEHRSIVEAIADRDADAAGELMLRHVGASLGARAASQLAAPASAGPATPKAPGRRTGPAAR